MIWAWIAAAVAISWLFCKKGISWYHYIWLLLPIEMYGVTIAGATLKPYMLFGICIIASDLVRDKTIRVPVAIIAAVFANQNRRLLPNKQQVREYSSQFPVYDTQHWLVHKLHQE